jgi:hypothetical protein
MTSSHAHHVTRPKKQTFPELKGAETLSSAPNDSSGCHDISILGSLICAPNSVSQKTLGPLIIPGGPHVLMWHVWLFLHPCGVSSHASEPLTVQEGCRSKNGSLV